MTALTPYTSVVHVGNTIHTSGVRVMVLKQLKKDGFITEVSPHLIDPDAPMDRQKFCISDNWVQLFLKYEMKWARRRKTKVAQVGFRTCVLQTRCTYAVLASLAGLLATCIDLTLSAVQIYLCP